MIEYDFTTIEYANWPDESMFGVGADDLIKTKIHLKKQDPLRTVDMSITVGSVGE